MADRQSFLTPLGVVMVGSGSDKTKARGERLWLDCSDADLSHGEANLAQLAASRPLDLSTWRDEPMPLERGRDDEAPPESEFPVHLL